MSSGLLQICTSPVLGVWEQDFTLWSHSCSPTTTTLHHHDHQESEKDAKLENVSYALADDSTKTKLKIIGDHMHAIVYLISDGVNPSNIERGYMVHHTTSHLLQSTLKRVIGQETSQAGSVVAFDRLRFDFNFHQTVIDKELIEINDFINQSINDGIILDTKVMSLTDAKGVGAIAMFGEKYGEQEHWKWHPPELVDKTELRNGSVDPDNLTGDNL
ncbi:putative alanine--tRNA ligase, chloroplastic [Capsicum baccatum]|uniref:alanine--tRNA ligase n=1 Tax=Capsicum baccatum TaxID=33114 RepID=A0A2G2WXU4_CAPBA|nr:putative alanine--tRNA ligase, chloroplastic [Capsicum baccatum]